MKPPDPITGARLGCRRSKRLQGMLEHEEGGPSTQGYHPEATDPAEVQHLRWLLPATGCMPPPACHTNAAPLQAGALAAPLWELTLLARHFHPHVAAASAQLAVGAPTPLLPTTPGSAPATGARYSTVTGGFTPAPRPWGKPKLER